MVEDQKIHVLGDEDIVLMFGLLGIEGTVVNKSENFLTVFNPLLNKPEIEIIIIGLNLPAEIIDFLIDFKLNSGKPLIHFLPNIYQENINNDYIFRQKIYDAIGDIVS